MVRLVLIARDEVREVEVGQELTIGRAYSNLLRLDGDEISRVHAIVYRRGPEYVIRDLDSKNGVSLNGLRVSTAALKSGDEIRIGGYHLVFDPPPNFNVSAYRKSHGIVTPAVVGENGEESDLRTYVGLSEALSGPAAHDSSVSGDKQPKVFFSIAEVEAMIRQDSPADSRFSDDLLKLHRALMSTPAAEETAGEAQVAGHFLRAVVGALGADRGVVIFEQGKDQLRLGAITPADVDVAVNRVVLRGCLRDGHAVLCNDVQHDKRFQRTDTVKKERIGSLAAFPLERRGQPVGLIYCDAMERAGAFRAEQLSLLCCASRLLMLSLSAAVARV